MAAAGTSEESPNGPGETASGNRLPRLAIVVAGRGSLTPIEAYSALRDSYVPVFLVVEAAERDDPASVALASTMRALARRAEVHWLPPATGRAGQVVAPIPGLSGITTFCADGVEVACRLTSEAGLPPLAADGGQGLYDKVTQRSALGPDLSPRHHPLPTPCCPAGPASADPHTGCNRQEWEQAAVLVGLPAVLKPARGQASRGVRPIADIAELRAARDEIHAGGTNRPPDEAEPAWLLEEFLAGHDRWPRAAYVSVESVVSCSDIRHVALTRKLPMVEPFRELGQYLLPRTPRDPESAGEQRALLDCASQALARLRVRNAVTHTELMLTPDGPKVIEVNARLGGLIRELVRAGRGLDLVRAAATVAVGSRPDCPDDPAAGTELVYQYGPLAPVSPAVFLAAHGVADVLSLPGVDRYLAHVSAGELLGGGTETVTMAVVSGACRDEEELAAVVTDLEKVLSYEYRLHPDGQVERCDPRGVPIG